MSSLEAHDGELGTWVTWLVETYELWQRIPACWAEHPACVAELGALHVYHAAASGFDGKTPLETALVGAGWHDYLGRALERLRTSPSSDCVRRNERGSVVAHREGKTWT